MFYLFHVLAAALSSESKGKRKDKRKVRGKEALEGKPDGGPSEAPYTMPVYSSALKWKAEGDQVSLSSVNRKPSGSSESETEEETQAGRQVDGQREKEWNGRETGKKISQVQLKTAVLTLSRTSASVTGGAVS